jgi:uncharacterized protein (TIGR02266 family)
MNELNDSGDSGSGRRRAPRADTVLRLHYRNAGHLLVSYCTNLSRGGLFVASKTPQSVGTKLTLSLAIPDSKDPARLQAEVRWVREIDAPEGPAGMGLAFDDVDDVLGERIDGIVSAFDPLQIAVIGSSERMNAFIGAQLRSLVTCETRFFDLAADAPGKVGNVDLVVIDIDNISGLAVLHALSQRPKAPPRVAICAADNANVRGRALKLARVVTKPIDVEELRTSVLETLTAVEASDD